MRRLSDSEENSRLDQGQRKEEALKSVDYDVWLCDTCNQHTVERYANSSSSFADCPSCGHKTVDSQTREVREATEYSSGIQQASWVCRNCRHRDEAVYYTPSLEREREAQNEP